MIGGLLSRCELANCELENLFDQTNAALCQLVDEGTITAEEYRRMAIGGWPRNGRHLLAPFAF
jgi:hypothetical protein